MEESIIRAIEKKDNQPVADIVRTVLRSFQADKAGTAFADPCLDNLYDTFQVPDAAYWVADAGREIAGGGGIYPTDGLPDGYCELVKLYLTEGPRGKGIGKRLINTCLSFATAAGFTHVYLETLPELYMAIPVYEKAGFRFLDQRLGESTHFACTIWMVKVL